MKRVLITGGTGFIGANLTQRLLADGYEVHLFLRAQHNPWRLKDFVPTPKIHIVDCMDSKALHAALALAKPDWIFHLATRGAYSWDTEVQEIVKTNVNESVTFLQAALDVGFEAFVNAGSSSEYGFKDHPPAEDEVLNPNSHYAISKAFFSMFCKYSAEHSKQCITTLRLYSVFGPYEDPRRLIPTLIRHGVKGGLPPLVNPEVARDFIYVEDVVEAFIQAAVHAQITRGKIYNIGTGVQTTMREVVQIAIESFSIKELPCWGAMNNRIWDTECWVANPRRAISEFGWRPTNSFADGFKKLLQWFQENPAAFEVYAQFLRASP